MSSPNLKLSYFIIEFSLVIRVAISIQLALRAQTGQFVLLVTLALGAARVGAAHPAGLFGLLILSIPELKSVFEIKL
jgi:hypothetical protein